MTRLQLEARDRTTVLVHYYRALVGRADIWRMRMDATTNWAIGATAAVVTFALGNASVPHFAVFIASALTLIFLLQEARRLTFYHLWQQRVLLLEDEWIRPTISGADETGDLVALEAQLGTTIPTMRIRKAAARRLLRVYLYLFAIQIVAWLFKLANHPEPAASPLVWLERAHAGVVPGAVVVGLVAAGLALAIGLALVTGGIDRHRSTSEPA